MEATHQAGECTFQEESGEPSDRSQIDNPYENEIRSRIPCLDEAITIAQTGSGKSTVESQEPPRLLLLSSRVKFGPAMQAALLPNVFLVVYKYELCDLDGVLGSLAAAVGTSKYESIALIFSSTQATISLCGIDEKILTKESILETTSLRDFFKTLANNHLDLSWVNARIDFLMCTTALSLDGAIIAEEISRIVQVPVGISKDLIGAEVPLNRIGDEAADRTVGSLYFRIEKLRPNSSRQTLALFEKIRVVGKGAYGSAVLYRKKDDDSLVVLKEINMHDLNAAERQMALNEVKVLSMLEHPNIIAYFDSFEEDGVLMIEMDYADGGTLAQMLGSRDKPLDEEPILFMFQQMVAAIRHIHGHNILHRDLKTANIFLTKENVVKVGDFGISKMMTTGGGGASTVLGTPYYISPEMCDGRLYGPKSDIWALGCILYEMACLQRTFEGSNLPALVNKIMKGIFTPVSDRYSAEFRLLVEKMLDRDPDKRPSADQLWTELLPPILAKYQEGSDFSMDEERRSSLDGQKTKKTTSVLYYLTNHSLKLSPIHVPSKIQIKELAVGRDHAIIVSQECVIYTYGRGTEGQLGHGDDLSRLQPTLVEALRGKSISRACCGDGFSLFSSNNGIVITCGSGSSGCLGHGDFASHLKPKLVEALLHVDVTAVACSRSHVAIVSSHGEVYTWGDGSYGKLGLGAEESHPSPQIVRLSEPAKITNVFCGETGTMLITDVGSVLAFGSNDNNKLGLNNRQGFLAQLKNAFTKTEVEGSKTPVLVRDLCRHRVTYISMGSKHTAVLTEAGSLITFGSNEEGQLGGGDSRPQQGLVYVKTLGDAVVTRVSCTDLATIVSVSSGQLLFWGSRLKSPSQPAEINWLDPSERRQPSAECLRSVTTRGSRSSLRAEPIDKQNSEVSGKLQASVGKISSEKKPSLDRVFSTDSDVRQSSAGTLDNRKSVSAVPPLTPRTSTSTASRPESISRQSSDNIEIHYKPTPLLNMDSDGSESLVMTGFHCHQENIIVLIETTAPPTHKKLRKKRSLQSQLEGYKDLKNSASSREAGDELSSSEASEIDTLGTIPSWIQQELAQAEQNVGDGVNSATSHSHQLKLPSTTSGLGKPSGKATVFTATAPESDKDDSDSELSSADSESVEKPIRESSEQGAARKPLPNAPIKSKSITMPAESQAKIMPRKSASESNQTAVTSRNEEHLQREIEQLREEKIRTEERMARLEQRYSQKVDDVREESAKQAAEKEKQLQDEMRMLRNELTEQNKKMQENFKMVAQFQEQLLRIQSESKSTDSASPTRSSASKSSICIVQ